MAGRTPPRISTPTARKALTPRDAPYWTELRSGLRLGYRKPQDGAAVGTWVLREFRAGKHARPRLGLADDLSPSDGNDIDVKESQIRVHHTKGGGERFVPSSREGVAFFAEPINGKRATESVFEHMRYMDVSRGMRAASEAAGITPRVTMHDLRRSYGSLMLDSGAPIEVIQHVLGHADMRMTNAYTRNCSSKPSPRPSRGTSPVSTIRCRIPSARASMLLQQVNPIAPAA